MRKGSIHLSSRAISSVVERSVDIGKVGSSILPSPTMTYTGNDFYCDVALKDPSALDVEFENEHILAFHHTKPHWPVHIVVVPKKHVPSFTENGAEDKEAISEVINVVKTIAQKVEKEKGAARILTNLGAYQDSKHLHFHVNSGEPLSD